MSRAAAIQMRAGDDLRINLRLAELQIHKAADAGAELLVLPENFAFMGSHDADKVALREQPGRGPIQDFLAQQANRHRVWIVGGTLPMVSDQQGKVRAASLVFDDHGHVVARYDKIYLFDVTLNADTSYQESRTIDPGDAPVVVDTPLGRLGLAICYDLRFPELFRALIDQGAELFALPAAFTAITGQAHWEPLLRARAIENQCYLIAANQWGIHPNAQHSWGHSMVVDPWGQFTQTGPTGDGFVTIDTDLAYLHQTREDFPALKHRRLS